MYYRKLSMDIYVAKTLNIYTINRMTLLFFRKIFDLIYLIAVQLFFYDVIMSIK